jgi:hypothetical protein
LALVQYLPAARHGDDGNGLGPTAPAAGSADGCMSPRLGGGGVCLTAATSARTGGRPSPAHRLESFALFC